MGNRNAGDTRDTQYWRHWRGWVLQTTGFAEPSNVGDALKGGNTYSAAIMNCAQMNIPCALVKADTTVLQVITGSLLKVAECKPLLSL